MRFIMRFIVKNLLTLSLILALIFSFLLVTTETGLKIAVATIEKLTPIKLSVKEAHGNIYSSFLLKNITYVDANQSVNIETFALHWNPLGLLLNKFAIENLVLKNTQIILKDSSSSQQTLNWNKLALFSIKQFTVDHLSIRKGKAQLDFNGSYHQQWQGDWRMSIPDLMEFNPEIGGSFYSEGKMTGTLLNPILSAKLKANNILFSDNTVKEIQGSAKIFLQSDTESALVLTATDVHTQPAQFKKIIFDTRGKVNSNHTATANLKINLDNQYMILGNIHLPKFTSFFDFSQPLSGKITTRTHHLEWITSLYQEIKEPKGQLDATLLLKGTFQQPIFETQIFLSNGELKVPSVGITVNHINLEAQQQKNLSEFTLKGSCRSGDGKANIEGNINLDSPTPVALNLHGTNLQFVNLAEYKIIASPTLHIAFSNHILSIEGDVPIVSADIQAKHFGTTLSLPDEVIFVEEAQHTTSVPLDVAIKINLLLSNKIHVVYNDLQTFLRGKLTIHWTPKANTTAIGELYAVNGNYTAYGQTLSILEGRLIYTGGPLNNPGLNIRAGKQVKTVVLAGQSNFGENWTKPIYAGTEMTTVGVQILGTFDNRTVSLFSNPGGLSQNDILSYLTFGYPQSQISAQQNKILLKAASAVNFGGKHKWTSFTDQIQNKLGLSEMNVESTPVFNPTQGKIDSATSFVIGKQISSNLYAHYSIGLFNPISTLNLRYQLSKRFAIQSETSQLGNGADLLYSIERD